MTTKQAQDWWQAFYEDTPFELFLERKDPTEVSRTVTFLIAQLRLSAGATVFDQCCGMGSLAIPLAERGYPVVGVDLCTKYIKAAQDQVKERGLNADFFCGDAFAFKTNKECDAGFNWWTSFGYADNDARNMLMLQRAAESIKKRGRFALDYPNVPHVLRHFAPLESSDYQMERGNVHIDRETVMDLHRGVRAQKWTFTAENAKPVSHDTALRLYLPHNLSEMMQTVGFRDITMFGNVDGSPLTVDSPRCIVVGVKA